MFEGRNTQHKGNAMLTITAKHPVRLAVVGLPLYYDSKGDLLHAIRDVFAAHNIEVESAALDGDEGHVTLELRPVQTAHVVCECCAATHDRKAFANCVVVFWYTMQSGRIELTSYVS
jgi:hypothetical protein